MKFHSIKFRILLLGGFCCIFSLARAGVIPDGFPVSRYTSLWEHSPFTTASVQQEVSPDGFASKLALVGVARIGSEDMATLLNKESQERITVSSQPNDQGLKLVLVESNADILKASVTIQKGGETAKVKFDQSLLAVTQSPPNGTNNVMQQGIPPFPRQPNINPSASAPRPVRRVLPIPAPMQGAIPARTINVPPVGTLPLR
jgi:hypothetical protein